MIKGQSLTNITTKFWKAERIQEQLKENLEKKYETKRDVQYKTAIAEKEKKVYLAFSHPSKVT